MASHLMLTPSRDLELTFDLGNVELIMTPKVKKDLTSLFLDDDSGLGMDDDQGQTTPTTPDGLSLFGFSGRLNFDDSIEKVGFVLIYT